MTIKELIRQLSDLDPTWDVLIGDDYDRRFDRFDVLISKVDAGEESSKTYVVLSVSRRP